MKMSIQAKNYFRFVTELEYISGSYGWPVVGHFDEEDIFTFGLESKPIVAKLFFMEGVSFHVSIIDTRLNDDSEKIIPVSDDISDYGLRELIRQVLFIHLT